MFAPEFFDSLLLDYVQQCGALHKSFSSNLKLVAIISQDVERFRGADESDLPPIEEFFAEVMKEGLLRKRARNGAVPDPRAAVPYLESLRKDWKNGRWRSGDDINANAASSLDPRYARYLSLIYSTSTENLLGQPWPAVMERYNETIDAEIAARSQAIDRKDPSRASLRDVEQEAQAYFSGQGWSCQPHKSNAGNILTLDRHLTAELVYRCSLTFGHDKLLDHIDAWFSIVPNNSSPSAIGGGRDAVLSIPLRDLIMPAGRYYLLHEAHADRIAGALQNIDLVLKIATSAVV